MNYIGIIMNKMIYFLVFIFVIHAETNLYWDLGIAISPYSSQKHSQATIELSTYNRIEGLKKYYIDDFNGALFHFKALSDINKQPILYEYINSYYSIGDYIQATAILENYNNNELSDNILYLKSKVFMMMGDYEQSFLTLEYLKNNFPGSDYLGIIKFDLEKINLLK